MMSWENIEQPQITAAAEALPGKKCRLSQMAQRVFLLDRLGGGRGRTNQSQNHEYCSLHANISICSVACPILPDSGRLH